MRSIETTAAKLSVFKMTWPIFIEILLQMMVGNVDQFMLSHYSQKSVAAVGNANQIINIVIIALSVISMAATIPVSYTHLDQAVVAVPERYLHKPCQHLCRYT